MEKIKWLFGFRTRTPWKMLVATIYYLFGLAVLVVGLFTPTLIPASFFDTVIYKITVIILFFWIESPAIFLSDTPLRSKLPFFKQRTIMGSLVGMMTVVVIFTYIFATFDNFHSEDYKTRFLQYLTGGTVQETMEVEGSDEP